MLTAPWQVTAACTLPLPNQVECQVAGAARLYFWNESILGSDVVTATVDGFAQNLLPRPVTSLAQVLVPSRGSYLDANDSFRRQSVTAATTEWRKLVAL